MTPVLAKAPVGTTPTTGETIGRDLLASRIQLAIEEALLDLNGPEVEDCHAWSHVIPRWVDAETYDALVMLLADRLYQQEHPLVSRRLIALPVEDREPWIKLAHGLLQIVRRVYEGQDDGALLQAAQDWRCHAQHCAQAVEFRRRRQS